MKKILSILLAVLLTFAFAAALAEDAAPQPEGGKKFEGSWALAGGLIDIVYEEEGYRVQVDLFNNETRSGSVWEYNCYYREATDSLVSLSSLKRSYTTGLGIEDRIDGEIAYDDMDEEGQESVFAINENGALTWTDGHGLEATADLEFRPIGSFRGTWRSVAGEEPVWVEMTWEGLNEERYFYNVYLHRGDDKTYTEFLMTGRYNEITGQLVCTGTAMDQPDGETYEAIFTMTEDGKLLYEAANGIVMEQDPLGDSQG